MEKKTFFVTLDLMISTEDKAYNNSDIIHIEINRINTASHIILINANSCVKRMHMKIPHRN